MSILLKKLENKYRTVQLLIANCPFLYSHLTIHPHFYFVDSYICLGSSIYLPNETTDCNGLLGGF